MTFNMRLLVFLFSLLFLTTSVNASKQSKGFFGGMMGDLNASVFKESGPAKDSRLLHIGGGGGSRLGSSPWLIGGKGASTSLINASGEIDLHMRYGGFFLIYTLPVSSVKLGIEGFLGGGSYTQFEKQSNNYIKKSDSFFLLKPAVHTYIFISSKMIVDLNLGYLFTTSDESSLKGLTLGCGLLFGNF